MRVALIFGISGQDGSYLSELLLSKDYIVHGVIRRSSNDDLFRIKHIQGKLSLHVGDVTDACGVRELILGIAPHEIYNLAGQSDVGLSFQCPLYTTQVNGLGVLHILEAVRSCGLTKICKVYQASTSEMFGSSADIPQSIRTPFHPRSPYGVSKLYGHWIVLNYREAYGMFAVSGILFNHESPRRGIHFVTQKVIRGVVDILHGSMEPIVLGNLQSKRDWGHAKDYVRAMWLMLQNHEPKDYTICTGYQCTVREFVTKVFERADLELTWTGEGVNECGILDGRTVVRIDPRYFRPIEVDSLMGSTDDASRDLGWYPAYELGEIIHDMLESELQQRKIPMNLKDQ